MADSFKPMDDMLLLIMQSMRCSRREAWRWLRQQLGEGKVRARAVPTNGGGPPVYIDKEFWQGAEQ